MDEIITELKKVHKNILKDIERKMAEFKSPEREKIMYELFFSLLTPQSKAELCWEAVLRMKKAGLFSDGKLNFKNIVRFLKGIRFKNKKAKYIEEAGRKIDEIYHLLNSSENDFEIRKKLVRNVKGMGYKEASHFMRNVGRGENFAILDRHILKMLKSLNLIEKIPENLTEKKYLEIEDKMRKFSDQICIPLSVLDFVFFYKKTGRIFK